MTEAETNPPEHYMGFQVTEAETERGLREALAKILPIRVVDGPDYAEVYFGEGTAHSTRAKTMNPQDWRDIAAAIERAAIKRAADNGETM